MGRALATWESRVRALLGNPGNNSSGITNADVDEFVFAAVRKFSGDYPRVLFSDFAGNGSTFDLTKPAAWVDRFSSVRAVEYPQGERPAEHLDMAEVSLYPLDSAPTHIRLEDTTPQTGKTARVYFTVPWPLPTATAGDDKIADTDYEAVAELAAGLAALELAARAAGNKHPTIPSADSVDWQSEADRWRRIGQDYIAKYRDHVGGRGGEPPASAVFDWDAASTWRDTGRRFLFRGRR